MEVQRLAFENMHQLLQIVPRMAPGQDGVGDYGLTLARELRRRYALDTTFVGGAPNWQGASEVEGFRVLNASGQSGAGLARLLKGLTSKGSTVMLNYVGPGYDRNSCPFWLLRGLKDWKMDRQQCRWITMFHELYSEGPPWTRSFWSNPVQRHIAAGIARISDVVVTSVGVMEKRLQEMVPVLRGRIDCVPVFSNVGETEDSLATVHRKPWLAVFGSAGWRTRAYREFGRNLEAVCDALGVEQLIDIGPPLDFSPELSVVVKMCGRLDAAEVAGWLRQCRFGFVTYPSAWLGKSGIFAAYCAHGCIPLAPPECRQTEIEIGGAVPVQYCDVVFPSADWPSLQRRVHDWYWPHSLQNQARRYIELFGSVQ